MEIKYEIVNQTRTEENTLDYELLKSLEGVPLNTAKCLDLFFFQDEYEKYLKIKEIKSAKKKESLKREMERFYENVEIVKVGRKNMYKLTGLYPAYEVPLNKLVKTRSKEDLRASFEAILLYVLKYDVIPEIDLTSNQWLNRFGYLNINLINSYKEFHKNKNNEDYIESFFRKHNLKNDIIYNVNGCETDRYLTIKEKRAILENYFSHIDMLKDTFMNGLQNLQKNKLISYDSDIYYGITKKVVEDFSGEERIIDDHVRLELEEKKLYLKHETRLREELDLDNNRKYYMNKNFKSEIKKVLKQGLEAELYNGVKMNRSFTGVYRKIAIFNKFTEKQLQSYLAKNPDVKEKYNLITCELLQLYRESVEKKFEAINSSSAKKKVKYFEELKNKEIEDIKNKFEKGLAVGKIDGFLKNINNDFRTVLEMQDVYSIIGNEINKDIHINYKDNLDSYLRK